MITQSIFKIFKYRQRGFTLIEVIVAVAITGIIGLGASATTIQLINQGTRNSHTITASRQTSNAINWISRDAQMSQSLQTSGQNGFPLTLSWTNWDNSIHVVTYSIINNEIRRSYSINGVINAETIIAQHINTTSGSTTCQFSNEVLTLQVTATVGSGSHAISVTEHSVIGPRPGM